MIECSQTFSEEPSPPIIYHYRKEVLLSKNALYAIEHQNNYRLISVQRLDCIYAQSTKINSEDMAASVLIKKKSVFVRFAETRA